MKALRIILIASLIFISKLNAQIGGHALKFDGVDDYLSTTYSTDLSSWTIECWIKGNSAPTNSKTTGVVHREANYNISWDHTEPGKEGTAQVRVGPTWYATSFGTLNAGNWYHLAATYDGEVLRAYKNGKLYSSNADMSGSPATEDNTLTIGKHSDPGTSNLCFAGMIDEVRIWNVVRTEAEITANMYKEIGTNSNLKVYYKMNDGTGATTFDNSENGYTGTLQGPPLWKASGALAGPGNTLTFASANSTKVTTPTSLSDAMSGSPVLTVAGWVNPSSLADWQAIYSRVAGVDYTKRVIIQASGNGLGGNDDFYISVANGTNYGAYTQANVLQVGVWTHFALVFDGNQTGDANRLKFYINGVLQTLTFTGASGSVPATVHTASESATIGSENVLAYFSGYIDELSIWTSARPQSSIRNMMCRSLSGDETGLQAYYRFDASAGTTAYDNSLNGRHGTLVNRTFDANSTASTAFNTWIGGVSSSASAVTNWSSGVTPHQRNVGIYKWPGGSSMTMDFGPDFYNTFIAADSDPSMTGNFTVDGNFFVNDDLDLAGGVIYLGQKGYLSEGTGRIFGATGRVQGWLYTVPALGSNLDFHNTGFAISSPSEIIDVDLSRYHGVKTNDWGTSISRNYIITQGAKKEGSSQMSPSGGGNPGVRFTYNDQELNGIPENNLLLAFSSDNGTTWTTYPGTVNTTENTVTVNEVPTIFGLWTLTNSSSPLPVELAHFTSSVSGKTVTLKWETKTEVMNHGFEIERKAMGGDWQKIGFIEGHGTSNSPKYYSFSDQPTATGKILYRLKQIDTDGGFEYSPEISVEMGLPAEFALNQNYPNPFNPETVIGYALPVAGEVTLEVFNSLGEKIATLVSGTMEAGNHQVKFRADNLPSGLYFYRINVTGVKNFASTKKLMLLK